MFAIVMLSASNKSGGIFNQELYCRKFEVPEDEDVVYEARLQNALREAIKKVSADYNVVYGKFPIVTSISVFNP